MESECREATIQGVCLRSEDDVCRDDLATAERYKFLRDHPALSLSSPVFLPLLKKRASMFDTAAFRRTYAPKADTARIRVRECRCMRGSGTPNL